MSLAAACAAAAGERGRDRVEAHLEPTVASLGATAWNLPGSALRDDTLAYSVELSLAPAFTLFHTALPGGLPGDWRLVAVPKMVVRRSDGLASNPVRSPGYQPSAALYVEPRGPAYFSLGLAHYSNGQAGPLLRPDGSLNDVDGSFSLWSQSAGIHLVNARAFLPEYTALRVEHVSHKEAQLDALYPDWTVSLLLSSAERAHAWGFLRGRSRFTADLQWLPRTSDATPNALKPSPFAATLGARYVPVFGTARARDPWKGFALFARFYSGYDYYNLNFGRDIRRLDIGLMAGPGT